MLKKGSLVLYKSPYNNQHKIKDFSVSVVLDPDVGNNKCHIRDIYRIDGGRLIKTMNWSNVNIELIKGIIMDISDIEYDTDFVNITQDKITTIEDFLIESIPEYLI